MSSIRIRIVMDQDLWSTGSGFVDQDQMSRLAELTGSAVVLAGAWRTWPCNQDFLWWLYYALMIISGWLFDDLMINLTGLHINLPLLKSPAPPEVINPLLPFNFPASTSSSTWLCWFVVVTSMIVLVSLMDEKWVNVRIAHLRIALWGSILWWAILSQSVIRIAHPVCLI